LVGRQSFRPEFGFKGEKTKGGVKQKVKLYGADPRDYKQCYTNAELRYALERLREI